MASREDARVRNPWRNSSLLLSARRRRRKARRISKTQNIDQNLAERGLALSGRTRRDIDKAIGAGLSAATAIGLAESFEETGTRATSDRRKALQTALNSQKGGKGGEGGGELELSAQTIEAIAQATVKLLLETQI